MQSMKEVFKAAWTFATEMQAAGKDWQKIVNLADRYHEQYRNDLLDGLMLTLVYYYDKAGQRQTILDHVYIRIKTAANHKAGGNKVCSRKDTGSL